MRQLRKTSGMTQSATVSRRFATIALILSACDRRASGFAETTYYLICQNGARR